MEAREGEKEIIARIVDLASSGATLSEISATLNREKRPTRYGGPWHPKTVSNILKRAKWTFLGE